MKNFINTYEWHKALASFDPAIFQKTEVPMQNGLSELQQQLGFAQLDSLNMSKFSFGNSARIEPLIEVKDNDVNKKETLLDPSLVGRDSPQIEYERLLQFERTGESGLADVKVLPMRVEMLEKRVSQFRMLMVLLYTTEGITRASDKLMLPAQLRDELTAKKQGWVNLMIKAHSNFAAPKEDYKARFLQVSEKSEEEQKKDLQEFIEQIVGPRGSTALCDAFFRDLTTDEIQLYLADYDKFQQYILDQFAKLTTPEIAYRRCLHDQATEPRSENDIVMAELAYRSFKKIYQSSADTALHKVVKKMRKCTSLQIAANKNLFNQPMKARLNTQFRTISKQMRYSEMTDLQEAQIAAQLLVHAAAITKDSIHLLSLITLICRVKELSDDAEEPAQCNMAFNQALIRELSLYPSVWVNAKSCTNDENVVGLFEYLEKHHETLAADLRQDADEDSYRNLLKVLDQDGNVSVVDKRYNDADMVSLIKQLQSHDWIDFFARIIQHHTLIQVEKLRRALPSSLIVQADFSITKLDKQFLKAIESSMNALFSHDNKNLVFSIQTINALLYANIYASKFNCQAPLIPDGEEELFGPQMANKFKAQYGEDVESDLYQLDYNQLTDYWRNEKLEFPLNDVLTVDLTKPLDVCKAINAAGFLDAEPSLLADAIMTLISRLEQDYSEEMGASLHFILLAIISHDNLLNCQKIEQNIYDLIMARYVDLDKEVRGDIIRFIIVTRLRRMLKPSEPSFLDQPANDSVEAQIMQSDLMSGGIEPHLFHLFAQEELESMLADAKLGQNTELVELFEKAAANKNKIPSENQDCLLEQILGKAQFKDDDQDQQARAQALELLFKGLQLYMRSKVSLSRIGGENGQKLTRAAFAAMVKLAGLTMEVERVVLELEVAAKSLPEAGAPMREQDMLEVVLNDKSYHKILIHWISAAKMRIWINAKKQRVIGRLTNDEQTEEEQSIALNQAEAEVNEIVDKIIEKASFLLSLAQPASFKHSDLDEKDEDADDCSAVKEKQNSAAAIISDEDNERQSQHKEAGIFKHRKETLKQIREASSTSVLACLQSSIQLDQIKRQVHLTCQNAVKRLAAFNLMEILMTRAPDMQQVIIEVLNDLQGANKNKKILHYTDGIKGCGIFLEEKIQTSFFNILSNIPPLMQQDGEPAFHNSMLRLLEWKFSARDFGHLLQKLPIFNILESKGNSQFHKMLEYQDSCSEFKRRIFKQVFFAIAARAMESEVVENIPIKESGLRQTFSRRKSILNESTSQQILSQAYSEIFSYFASMIDFYERLDTAGLPELPSDKLDRFDLEKIIDHLDQNKERAVPADSDIAAEVLIHRNTIMDRLLDLRPDSVLDRLSMLKLQVNVSLASLKSQQMLVSLVSPGNLAILLKMLLVFDSNAKIHVIQILDGLRRNQMPIELFDEAAKPLLEAQRNEKLVFSQNLTSPYARLLYTEAAKIWSILDKPISKKENWRDEPNYAVCRLLLRLVISVAESCQVETALALSIQQLGQVGQVEQHMLFDMLDASINFVSEGDQAVLAKKAFALQSVLLKNDPFEVMNMKVALKNFKLNANDRRKVYSQEQCQELMFFNNNLQPAPLSAESLQLGDAELQKFFDCFQKPNEGNVDYRTKLYIAKFLLKNHDKRDQMLKEDMIKLYKQLATQASDKDHEEGIINKLIECKSRIKSKNLTSNAMEKYLGLALRSQLDYMHCSFEDQKPEEKKVAEVPVVAPEHIEITLKTQEDEKEEKPETEANPPVEEPKEPRRRKITRNYYRVRLVNQENGAILKMEQVQEWLGENNPFCKSQARLIWPQAWYAVLDDSAEKQKALLTIQMLMNDMFVDKKQTNCRGKHLQKRFQQATLKRISDLQLSNQDVKAKLQSTDFTAFYAMVLKLEPFDRKEGIGQVQIKFGEGLLDHSILQARDQKPFKMDKSLDRIDSVLSLEDAKFASQRIKLIEQLLLSRFQKRLYLELSATSQLSNEALAQDELKILLNLWQDNQHEKSNQRCINDWQNLPRKFETTILHAILDRFSRTNGVLTVLAFLREEINNLLLLNQTQVIESSFFFKKQNQEEITTQVAYLTGIAQWLSQSKRSQVGAVLLEVGFELVQCILLQLHNLTDLITQVYGKLKQKCLLSFIRVLQALIDQLLDREELEELFEKIWALPSLQAFLPGLPEQIDEIMTLSEYKFAEICTIINNNLKLKIDQETKVGRLVTSLAKLKNVLSIGISHDKEALEKLLKATQQVVVEVAMPAAHREWQKIELKDMGEQECTKLQIQVTQKNLDGFTPAKSLCMFAAISDEPGFTAKTKIAIFNYYDSQWVEELERPSNGTIYIKYPLDRNFVTQMRSIHIETEGMRLGFRHLDTPRDPMFNPGQMIVSIKNNESCLIDETQNSMYKIKLQDSIPVMSWHRNEKPYRFQLPNGNKIKQISHEMEFVNFKDVFYATNVILLLTESGKLFAVEIQQTQDKMVTEIPLAKLGIKKKIVGMSDFVRYVWTEEGEIYELQSCCAHMRCGHQTLTAAAKLVSGHELQDGSKIAKVHEISGQIVRNNLNMTLARVTTTLGDQVVLSKVLPNITNDSLKMMGRKLDAPKTPKEQFHMLEYDYEHVRFTQIVGRQYANVAIDEDGEIWYLGGRLHKNKVGPIQLEHNWRSDSSDQEMDILKPICSNIMRRQRKVALKVCVGEKNIAVLTKDLQSGKISIQLLLSGLNESLDLNENINGYVDLVHNMLDDTMGQFEILDFINDHGVKNLSSNQINIVCKPNLDKLKTSLNVKVTPIIQVSQGLNRGENEEAIKKLSTGLRKLCKDKDLFNTSIKSNLTSRSILSNTVFNYLDRAGSFGDDKILQLYARQYFTMQQALFDSIYLYCLLKDDHYLKDWPAQQALVTKYIENNQMSDDLMRRLRINQIIRYKKLPGQDADTRASMNRIKAAEFQAEQRYEKPGEVQTLFTQLMFNYIKAAGFENLDTNNKEPFTTHFFMERSYDCGGPMRDTVSSICNELMSSVLPLMRPTANNVSNFEPGTDCYQINERAREPHNMQKLTFLGYFLGWAFISIGSLNVDMSDAFWARLAGGLDYVYTLDDLYSQDVLMARNLTRIREAASSMNDEDFAAVYGGTAFVLEATDQHDNVIELCEGGSNKALMRENSDEYIKLFLQAYTRLDELQFRTLYLAFENIATHNVLAMVSPQIAKRRICSSSIIDLIAMKASTTFYFGSQFKDEQEQKEAKEMFWQMITEISNEDRQLVMKFLSGRTRLQPGVKQYITFQKRSNDESLPIGHTCGNNMEMQFYSSLEKMKQKVLLAVRLCGEIDGDAEYLNDDEYGENEGGEEYEGQEFSMQDADLNDLFMVHHEHERRDYRRRNGRNEERIVQINSRQTVVESTGAEVLALQSQENNEEGDGNDAGIEAMQDF